MTHGAVLAGPGADTSPSRSVEICTAPYACPRTGETLTRQPAIRPAAGANNSRRGSQQTHARHDGLDNLTGARPGAYKHAGRHEMATIAEMKQNIAAAERWEQVPKWFVDDHRQLLALAEAVGEYMQATNAPSDGSITGDRERARRKVAARHDMYAKYLALEAGPERSEGG